MDGWNTFVSSMAKGLFSVANCWFFSSGNWRFKRDSLLVTGILDGGWIQFITWLLLLFPKWHLPQFVWASNKNWVVASIIFDNYPRIWGNDPIWPAYFSIGLVQPATSKHVGNCWTFFFVGKQFVQTPWTIEVCPVLVTPYREPIGMGYIMLLV